MFKNYKKKPVVIQAFQLTKKFFDYYYANPDQALLKVSELKNENIKISPATECIIIITSEGSMKARVGDFIIIGVNGEYYPCKPDVFKKTYEEVKALGMNKKQQE